MLVKMSQLSKIEIGIKIITRLLSSLPLVSLSHTCTLIFSTYTSAE